MLSLFHLNYSQNRNIVAFSYLCKNQSILSLPRFIIYYFLFISIIAGIVIVLPYVFPTTPLFIEKFWVVFGFVAGITFIAYLVAYIGIQRKPEMGVMAIMGSIALKMLFSMAFVLVYVLSTPVNSLLFVLNFFSLYFLFSGFEIYALLCNLRHSIKK